MPAHRKASIRDLSKAAYELESGVLEGELTRDPDTGAWMVGAWRLDTWLDRFEEQEVVLIVASLDDERPMPLKTCRTCGREYKGVECPICLEARTRLRGR